jgi:hypothetical protein
MADIYQGKIGTISPAVGNYYIQTYYNIDRGITGIGASGVTGANTLTLIEAEQGLTGIQASNFTNLKSNHSL